MLRKPLWKCPKCGRAFVVRNVVHTCNLLRPEVHLQGKSPAVKALYRGLEGRVRFVSRGGAHVVAYKTGIAFRGRVNFIGVRVLRHKIEAGLLLPGVVASPRVKKVFTQSHRSHMHYLDLRTPGDFDAEFMEWLRDAWRAGRQLQLREPGSWQAARDIPEPAAAPERPPRKNPRPLWRCPKCGKLYVTRNMSHSCRRIAEAERLAGKSERVIWLYRRIARTLRDAARALELERGRGAATLRIVPGKSSIVFQGRMRFAGVRLGKDAVRLSFLLRRRLDSPRVKKVLSHGPVCYGHEIIIRHADDLDADLRVWLAASLRVGLQLE